MNDALNYIEENLTVKTDYKEIARKAGCSEYHFTRMFSSLINVPLSEYIRRRRLTLATDYSHLNEVEVPAATWAVFTTQTSKDCVPELQEIWKLIFSEWFPTSSYEHAPLPECEIYRCVGDEQYAEVWIPVVQK